MSSPCLICVALTAISLMVFCHSMFRFLKSCESISNQFYDFWFFHALAPHAEDQMHAGVHQVVVILDAEARQLRDQILRAFSRKQHRSVLYEGCGRPQSRPLVRSD